MSKRPERIRRRVAGEGDEIFYQSIGAGPAIVMIPGAGGDGNQFLPLADRLAERYRVIALDRRGNGRSPAANVSAFSVEQQARDVRAVLQDVGEPEAFVLGVSSGAVIALELLRIAPALVRTLVAFEPPLPAFADDPDRWRSFFRRCHRVSQERGASRAAASFGLGVLGRFTLAPLLAGLSLWAYLRREPKDEDARRVPAALADEIFIDHELLPVTEYVPDLDALSAARDKLVLSAGDWTVRKRVWLARVAETVSTLTGGTFRTLPGSHVSYQSRPAAWASELAGIFTG